MDDLRILVFGASNAMGYGLDDPATESWPMLLGSALSAAHGHPVSVVRKPLYIEGSDPTPYIREQLAEHSPDIVLFAVAAPGFALATVANSVGKLAGRRARSWLIRAEVRLQNLLGPLGTNERKFRRTIKRGVRKAARARPRLSVGESIISGQAAIRAIAAHESVASIIRVPLEAASWVYEEQAAQLDAYSLFRDEMRKRTKAARMAWVEEGLVLTPDEEREVYLPDGIHITAAGHKRAAALWLAATMRECDRMHAGARRAG